MSDSTSQDKKTNLARIRDNQRRSRARRKDYLQELEAKYRQCEQTGVEASAEIQAAARRVVGENKRLRQLLKQQGMSDRDIDACMQASDKPENPQFPSEASMLEDMLGLRKQCSTSSCGSGSSSDPRQRTGPRLQQSPNQRNSSGSGIRYHSPTSTATSGVATPSTLPYLTSTATTYPLPAPMHPPHFDYGMHFDDNISWHTPFPHSPSLPTTPAQQHTGAGTSSCYAAAGAVRSIKPDIGNELERDLGCLDGRDCHVPNDRIFEMMDRYSTNRI